MNMPRPKDCPYCGHRPGGHAETCPVLANPDLVDRVGYISAESAAQGVLDLLRRTKTPQHAAGAMALAMANLWLQGGGDTEQKVRGMMADDDRAALDLWSTISKTKLAN